MNTMREEFEAVAKRLNISLGTWGGEWKYISTINAYQMFREGWQAARQPVGEVAAFDQQVAEFLRGCPVAHVPVHPRQGPLWSDTVAAVSEVHRSNSYPLMPLYAAPPQQPERVYLGQFREAVQYASRTCPHEDLAPKLHELLALINQQESKP